MTRTLIVMAALAAATVVAAGQAPAPSPAASPGAAASPRPAPAPSPSPSPAGEPDIEISATVRWRDLRFDQVGTPRVEFTGTPERDTVWEAERENLPRPVQPGVTYHDGGIRLVISSRFRELAAALEGAASPAPGASPSPSAAPSPAASPLPSPSPRGSGR